RLCRRPRLPHHARYHGGLCAWGRRDQLDGRERARHRTQRRVPGRDLWLLALGRRLVSAALADPTDWMSTDRVVNVFGTDQRTSNFSAHDFSGRIESGYRFALPLVSIPPYGAFQAQRLYLPAYSEVAPAGSPFALTYNAQNFATTRSELGA